MNPNVAYLYQPYHPALHRLIKNVIEAAHAEKKWVGLCGEIASDPYASLLLVGLGIDELSMTSSSILEIKNYLSKSDYNDLTVLANSIIQDEETNQGVLEKLQNYFKTSISDSL
jgi:phosphotransferase system enzyme I (PtsI)